MSGDWIKMRTDLGTAPKVVRIMSALQADRLRVVGALHAIWSIFDDHTSDGKLNHYTPKILDDMIGWEGFAQSMLDVGWLKEGKQSLVIPRFTDHNGQSAKRRAQDSDRKRTVREVSASKADKKRTREEKRRVLKTHAREPAVDNSGDRATNPATPSAKNRAKANPSGVPSSPASKAVNGSANWQRSERGTVAHGKALGIEARPGESMDEYRVRLAQHRGRT